MRDSGTAGRPGLALLACVGLGACEVPRAVNPAEIWREVSGANDAVRPSPPGLDRPFPSLRTVPPRPDRPSPEALEALAAALAADRNRSREPLTLRAAPGGSAAGAMTGMAAGPPSRPTLAGAPRIPWMEAAPAPRQDVAAPPARGGEMPSATPSAVRPPTARSGAPVPPPDVPDAAPAPPPPDLLGAPPPPPPDLMAPPPPARR